MADSVIVPPDSLKSIVKASSCASYHWENRGRAPLSYTYGTALVFAKSLCHPEREDVKVVSAARKQPESTFDRTDALSWYNSNFKALGMTNDTDSIDTLRHAYTLLIGLGMMESSGAYCCGRDMSAGFSSASSAEAGIFQASWGARVKSPVLPAMFQNYKKSDKGCLLDVFKEGVKCGSGDAKNWGEGDGKDWQALTKSCPAFATEYAAVLLRTTGGTKGEFGPLRKKAVELRPECDDMLQKVQSFVQANPSICSQL
jgi:hypothetical protein